MRFRVSGTTLFGLASLACRALTMASSLTALSFAFARLALVTLAGLAAHLPLAGATVGIAAASLPALAIGTFVTARLRKHAWKPWKDRQRLQLLAE